MAGSTTFHNFFVPLSLWSPAALCILFCHSSSSSNSLYLSPVGRRWKTFCWLFVRPHGFVFLAFSFQAIGNINMYLLTMLFIHAKILNQYIYFNNINWLLTSQPHSHPGFNTNWFKDDANCNNCQKCGSPHHCTTIWKEEELSQFVEMHDDWQ